MQGGGFTTSSLMEGMMGEDTFLYHAKHGAKLFPNASKEEIRALEAQGWADSPGAATKKIKEAPQDPKVRSPRGR